MKLSTHLKTIALLLVVICIVLLGICFPRVFIGFISTTILYKFTYMFVETLKDD